MALAWVLIVILTGWQVVLYGQSSEVDSLKSLIDHNRVDSSQVDILNNLSYTILGEDPSETIKYGLMARDMAVLLNYNEGKAYALKNTGLGYYFQGDYMKVLDYWTQSLSSFRQTNNNAQVASMLSNLGAIYFTVGSNSKALEYYLQSLRLTEKIQDTALIAKALVNVAGLYSDNEKDYKKALQYFWQVGKLSESHRLDDAVLGGYLTGIGELYGNMGNYDSALFYLEKSIPVYENTVRIPGTLTRIGLVLMEKGDYESAIDYQEEAFQIAKENGHELHMTNALMRLGDAKRLGGDPNEALEAYRQAESIALPAGLTYELRDIYQGMSLCFAKQKIFNEAYKYQTQYQAIKDTLFNLETDDKVRGLQFTYEIEKKEDQIDLLEKDAEIAHLETRRQKAISQASGIVVFLLFILAVSLFQRFRYVRKTKKIIENEKNRSENLLLNILPEETAEELKENGTAKARSYDQVSILFTDFKGFTSLAANMSAEELVQEIHEQYKVFDEIVTHYDIEKIKTIGDAYMAAGGLPVPNDTNPMDVVKAALEIRDYMEKLKQRRIEAGKPFFEIRIGIHTGPVVAGIVGIKKFAYDIWGDTVNIASRMESNSEPGKINISQTTYDLVKEYTNCSYRGEIEAKNRGMLKMYFVENLKMVQEHSIRSSSIEKTLS